MPCLRPACATKTSVDRTRANGLLVTDAIVKRLSWTEDTDRTLGTPKVCPHLSVKCAHPLITTLCIQSGRWTTTTVTDMGTQRRLDRGVLRCATSTARELHRQDAGGRRTILPIRYRVLTIPRILPRTTSLHARVTCRAGTRQACAGPTPVAYLRFSGNGHVPRLPPRLTRTSTTACRRNFV